MLGVSGCRGDEVDARSWIRVFDEGVGCVGQRKIVPVAD